MFGKRAGEHAAEFAKENGAGTVNEDQVEAAAKHALAPFDRGTEARTPTPFSARSRTPCRTWSASCGTRPTWSRRSRTSRSSRERAERAGVDGNREYNPGWHTALDLQQHADGVRGHRARGASSARKAEAPTSARTTDTKSEAFATFNFVLKKGSAGEMDISREPIPPMPAELQQVIEENK